MHSRWITRCFVGGFTASKQRAAPTVQGFQRRYNHHSLHTTTLRGAELSPLRKELKDATKAARQSKLEQPLETAKVTPLDADWELTVGIEIHAQLNTQSKLFSSASTDYNDEPNTSLQPFDIAIPGSQPVFQEPVLIPAIRAALALNCKIQPESKFDRKHYFYHDQPSGYQITQYYQPFAVDGQVVVTTADGLPQEDGETLEVGIKQVQLEQDTARTQEQDHETNLVDFNRSGHPLIEIISLPHIHSPEAAAAYMRKVQGILSSVDAVTTGMELGGLRADVNVSVRRKNDQTANHSYSGVSGLGQRTEIKNLSSFKAVEDAVKAERDRQISILEAGGVIEGETRGWSLTSPHETRRLRGKEGEVDYRYMPDPDIPPLYIGHDLVNYFQQTLPPVPEALVHMLQSEYGMSGIDSAALLNLDDGARLIYFQSVVEKLEATQSKTRSEWGKIAGNWVLHELGALLTTNDASWKPELVPAPSMAQIIQMQIQNEVTGTSAKQLLRIIFEGDKAAVNQIAEREGLLFQAMSDQEYDAMISSVLQTHSDVVTDIQVKKKHGKVKFLLGQMMRTGDRNRMEAARAETLLRQKLGI